MRFSTQTTLVFALAAAAGCKSSSGENWARDSAVPDAIGQPDLHADAKIGAGPEQADVKPTPDMGTAALADGSDMAAGKDGSYEKTSTADVFVPGPIEAVAVNTGNSAIYDLADGTWEVFSFGTVADHLYCISGLGDGVVGYFGGLSVSPTDYEETSKDGVLFFSEYVTGTRYLAVAASGGRASGTFQVADGGELITSGDNAIDFAAADVDHYRAFHFNVAPGHNYTISVSGVTKNPVDLVLSPKAERAAQGEIAYPFSKESVPLPIADVLIPFESTAESYTRFYFIFLKVKEAVSLTVNITLAF